MKVSIYYWGREEGPSPGVDHGVVADNVEASGNRRAVGVNVRDEETLEKKSS